MGTAMAGVGRGDRGGDPLSSVRLLDQPDTRGAVRAAPPEVLVVSAATGLFSPLQVRASGWLSHALTPLTAS